MDQKIKQVSPDASQSVMNIIAILLTSTNLQPDDFIIVDREAPSNRLYQNRLEGD